MKNKAFTLIELLVVIAIIVLLVSILVPSLRRAKELAERVICLTTLRNHGMNIEMYTSENKGVYPAASGGEQFRYFYSALKDYYPESTLSGLDDDEPYLNYICQAFRRNFPVGAYLSLPGNPWWFQTHLYGYQHAFGEYYDPANSYVLGNYRSFGGVPKHFVGSMRGELLNVAGAVRAGEPDRMVMMSDFGFSYNNRVPGLREVGEWTHSDGWGALLADGHAGFFTMSNELQNWSNWILLDSDVKEN